MTEICLYPINQKCPSAKDDGPKSTGSMYTHTLLISSPDKKESEIKSVRGTLVIIVIALTFAESSWHFHLKRNSCDKQMRVKGFAQRWICQWWKINTTNNICINDVLCLFYKQRPLKLIFLSLYPFLIPTISQCRLLVIFICKCTQLQGWRVGLLTPFSLWSSFCPVHNWKEEIIWMDLFVSSSSMTLQVL